MTYKKDMKLNGGRKKKPIKIDGGQVQLGSNTRKQRLVVIRMQIFFLFEVSSMLLITVISVTKSSHL